MKRNLIDSNGFVKSAWKSWRITHVSLYISVPDGRIGEELGVYLTIFTA